jgi:hypothetical protein
MPCLKDMRCALQQFANAHTTLYLLASAMLPLTLHQVKGIETVHAVLRQISCSAALGS